MELIYWMNSFLCLQVNPIVGHLNFLLYDWKREVNHSLNKTPLKKVQLIWCRKLIFFGEKKGVFSKYIYISSKGPIRIHNYNMSIKIKHLIQQKTGNETRCSERISMFCSIILAPVVMLLRQIQKKPWVTKIVASAINKWQLSQHSKHCTLCKLKTSG